MDGKKKIFLIAVIIICVTIFFVLTIINYQKEDQPTSKSPTPDKTKIIKTEPTETNKLQSGKEYEEIIRNFYQAKNFAIETGDDSFLKEFLEEGSEYTNKVLSDVKNKNKASYKVLIFKEVKSVEGNVTTISIEIDSKNVIFKIKDVKDRNYLIIDEKIN